MGIRDKKFIYFNSSEIFKNDIIWGALELNINVEIAKYVVDINDYEEKDIIRVLEELENYDVAMTQNFVAAIAEACFRVKKPYISWVYDSPQRGLYLKEALYETNYIFVFDKNAIERLKTFDIKHIYYLPLSANMIFQHIIN